MSMMLSHVFSMTSNLCAPMGNSRDEGLVGSSHCLCVQVQVRSPDHKSCTPYVVPCLGPRWHRHSNGCMTVGLAVPFLCVTTDWELQCNQPRIPCSCVGLHVCVCVYVYIYIYVCVRLHGIEWWVMDCYSHGKGVKLQFTSVIGLC
jgi:hypothetical protein